MGILRSAWPLVEVSPLACLVHKRIWVNFLYQLDSHYVFLIEARLGRADATYDRLSIMRSGFLVIENGSLAHERSCGMDDIMTRLDSCWWNFDSNRMRSMIRLTRCIANATTQFNGI